MAQKQSKTARASTRAGGGVGGAGVTFLGEVKFLIPLNGGRNAYVRNVVTGRMPNVRTDSEAFTNEIKELAEAGHGSKLRAEIQTLANTHPGDGWDVRLKQLEEAGVLAS